MTATQSITLESIGPITRCRIPIPDGGGLVLLSGRNGIGKSQALSGVRDLMQGSKTVGPNDSAKRGLIDGFGVTLKVGRRSTRSGELEVIGLEGNLSPVTLIDPGIQNPEAADAARIKTILKLAGTQATPDDFLPLLKTRQAFGEVVTENLSDAADPVVMASRVKRCCESAARNAEKQADEFHGRVDAILGTMPTATDLTADDLSKDWAAELEAAVEESSRLKSQRASALDIIDRGRQARESLERAEKADAEPIQDRLPGLRQRVQAADIVMDQANERVAKARAALEQAEREQADARMSLENARQALSAEERHQSERADVIRQRAEAMQGWRDIIDAASGVECPTEDDLAAARQAVDRCRDMMQRVTEHRKALERKQQADDFAEQSKTCRQRSDDLRKAAHGTDDILSGMVSRCGTPLIVRNGRLWLETPKRGLTLFADLSRGEKTRIAIDIAIDGFPKDSPFLPLIVLEQEFMEGLDDANRRALIEHAVNRRVVLLSAVCSDSDELTATVLT